MLLSIERQYLPLVETLRNDNSLVEGVLTKLQLSFCQAIIFIADHTSLVTAEKDVSLECQLKIFIADQRNAACSVRKELCSPHSKKKWTTAIRIVV